MTSRSVLTKARVAWRSLFHYRRANVAIALSAATATAIITGALLVGDSVRGSLEDRVRERLGAVDYGLVGPRFFREELAGALTGVPAILLRGTVVHAETGRRASEVNVIGITPSFWNLDDLPAETETLAVPSGRRAVVNAWLAESVGASTGDTILVYTEKAGDIPAEHALGSREGTVRPVRLELESVFGDRGLALFDLRHGQATPRNVFVPLEVLQRALEKEELVNTILVGRGPVVSGSLVSGPGPETRLDEKLASVWTLADAGLRCDWREELGYGVLESHELLLPEPVVEAALAAAAKVGAETLEVLTYLANTVAVNEREVPYSTVAAVGRWQQAPALPAAGKEALASPGGVVLNDWAASDLGAKVGDSVRLDYYAVAADERLEELQASFTLRSVVLLAGAAADAGWTPTYPGITDSDAVRDWDPPFPIDLNRVRDKDEDYWDSHRATPKAFVSLEDGRRLWASRFGSLTSLRLRPLTPERSLAETVKAFRGELLKQLSPASLGLSFRAVKREGLEAARSGTDFAGLFLGFSFFLIISALILLSLVFRLSCERRARELGTLLSTGFSPRAVSGLLLREASMVVAVGAVVGSLGGLAYAATLIAGLRGWWREAVNAPFLTLHVTPMSLGVGLVATVFLAVGTVFLVARRLTRQPAVRLLSGASLLATLLSFQLLLGASVVPDLQRDRDAVDRGQVDANNGQRV